MRFHWLLITVSIFLTLIVYFVGSALLWSTSGDQVIVIDLWTITIFLGSCLGAGLLIGAVWLKLKYAPSDSEVKIVAGSSVGICILSGICAGGCLPAAVIGGVFSIFYIIPITLGIKMAGLFNTERNKNEML
jgi:hypothetical protein